MIHDRNQLIFIWSIICKNMNSYPQISNYETQLCANEFKCELKYFISKTVCDEETKYSQSFSQQCIKVVKWKSLSRVRLIVTHGLYSPWNSPGQIMEWVTIPFSRGSSQTRDRTQASCIEGRFFTSWGTNKSLVFRKYNTYNWIIFF